MKIGLTYDLRADYLAAGYTEEEKLQIAREHLLVPQIENHGLSTDQVTITDDTILEVILTRVPTKLV